MKKVIVGVIVIVIVVVILLGAYFLFKSDKDDSKESITEEEETTEDIIKGLFAEKYDKDISEISITIEEEQNGHIKGGVMFGEGGPGEGGWFLASKTDEWELVFDGNGSVTCEIADSYNFSAEMVPECYIEESGKAVDRVIESSCLSSGGEIVTSLCCKATNDYPNLCSIGACGCAPSSSREIRACDCGPDKCFDGTSCVSNDEIK